MHEASDIQQTIERIGWAHLDEPAPYVHMLSNGRYTAYVTGAGAGYSAFDGRALTRWTADRTRDADGYFLYVRDVETGVCWSAGHQPVRRTPERYAVGGGGGQVEMVRVDEGVETRVAICVAPDNVELRRCTLINQSDRRRRLDVTSYAEIALDTLEAATGHPAFSKLFVQTEYLGRAKALLARRRPRSPEDEPIWLVHWLVDDPGGHSLGPVQVETDRARFIGRCRTLAQPEALRAEARLSGTVGNVLDPIVSLRRVVELGPGERTTLTFGLGAGRSRAAVEALPRPYQGEADVEHACTRAAEAASASWPEHFSSAGGAARLARLTGALLYDHPAFRAPEAVLRRADRSPDVLKKYGLSGDGPLVVVRATDAQALGTLRALLDALAHWRHGGIPAEMLILVGAEGHASAVRALSEGRAGVFLYRADEMPEADQMLAQAVAGVVVRGDEDLDREQRPGAGDGADAYRPFRPAADLPAEDRSAEVLTSEPLRKDNGYGGFTEDGRAYVIRIVPDDDGHRRPPLPWINVVANETLGFLATEQGAGYTWSGNSRLNRLTPWSNDPVMDPHGEVVYVRDEDAGVFWSMTPGPVPQPVAYEVRHGFGYTTYRHRSQGLEQEVLQFVPRRDPVKVSRMRLTNHGDRPRRITVVGYARWVLGERTAQSGRFVTTEHDADLNALLATNAYNEPFADYVAFAAMAFPDARHPPSVTADRTAFLGRHGDLAAPAALRRPLPLDGTTGAGLDPCAALAVRLDLEPGETVEGLFLLGEAKGRPAAADLIRQYGNLDRCATAHREVQAFWHDILSAVQVETPSPAIDLMANGWLLYQTISCRLWGRSAFYQSGGAFGFRDQLQDAAALVYARPAMTRAQLLRHAAHQFAEGDVLHWWHPPTGHGIRTRFSDDLLWLPYVAAFYGATTGDWDVLDEPVPFLTARALNEGEDEAYLLPKDSDEDGTLYEHCCRALDRSLPRGAHGLPLMGTGDWNDGMNRVGRQGRGESVWLGFFLYDILHAFLPICERRGDDERARRYAAYRAHLGDALNDAGWDGAWYRRAYYDDGTPLGAAQNDECRIDALAQAWAVLSGAAPPARAARALDALEEHLIDEDAGLIRLLTPAFDETPRDPGYIKGYVPGVRENGGQYTHAAIWAVRALAETGRAGRATHLLEMLSPVSHTRTPDEVTVYQAEPYVIAADVYGVSPHVGRGGWTWYTGSAGWLYRTALESILGLRLVEGRTLVLDPCIPRDWLDYRLRYRQPGSETVYAIRVRNPDGREQGVVRATLDGEAVSIEDGAAHLPLVQDGAVHPVTVTLGG